MQDYFFLVPCAGYGSRMNSDIPKQYLQYQNKPIIYYTLKSLSDFDFPILLIVSPDDGYISQYQHLFSNNVNIQYIGGTTRSQSVLNGLNYISNYTHNNPWILVHDGARPLVNFQDVKKLIDTCINCQEGGLLAVKIVDTIKKKVNQNITTLDREGMYLAQTPQMFKLDMLLKALQAHENVSDEASAIEQVGVNPLIIEGSRFNIKITTQEDLAWLNFLNF